MKSSIQNVIHRDEIGTFNLNCRNLDCLHLPCADAPGLPREEGEADSRRVGGHVQFGRLLVLAEDEPAPDRSELLAVSTVVA